MFMRNIVNISIPKEMDDLVKREVKSGQFASKSEFFRHLIRLWNTEKLALDLEQSEKEFAAGKGKKLRNINDLDD